MLEMHKRDQNHWTVQFTSKTNPNLMFVNKSLGLCEAMRIVRGKLEWEMLKLEASSLIRETYPITTDEENAAALAELEEMDEAVNAIDLGLDEEIKQRRELRKRFPWVVTSKPHRHP